MDDGLREFRRVQDPLMTANCFFGSALVTGRRGAHDLAARMLGAAGALYAASGTQLLEALRPAHAALLSAARAALGRDRFEPEWSRGASLSVEDAVAQALDALSR
jgi:hypothetical protein